MRGCMRPTHGRVCVRVLRAARLRFARAKAAAASTSKPLTNQSPSRGNLAARPTAHRPAQELVQKHVKMAPRSQRGVTSS
eukprot:1283670-Pleurochrysis_carterae.AAC.3